MARTKINWTEYSWNPIVGCTKCSPGCSRCYAERMAARLASMGKEGYCHVTTREGKWNGKIYHLFNDRLDQPLHWRKPRRIFVCSMSDLFHPKVPFDFIHKIMRVVEKYSQHIFLMLTKRPQIAYDFFGGTSGAGLSAPPLPNLHFGVSISNQAEADEKIPILLQIPAAVRWLSVEPMLEEISLANYICKDLSGVSVSGEKVSFRCGIRWIVVGCESGPKRRPCKLEWVESIVEQCKAAGVKVFVKQLDINGKVEHNIEKFPKKLQIREFPNETYTAYARQIRNC